MSPRERERQRWMAAVERFIVADRPALAGRIEWAELAWPYMQNVSADDAARRYVERVGRA